jgi:hypothetical protein
MGRWIVGVLLVLGMVLGSTAAQDTTADVAPLATQFETLETTTESIRGLETLNEVEKAFPTRAEVQDYIKKSVDIELSDEAIDELMAFYVAFDFLDAKTDLRAVYSELLGEQVAGYYDTETKLMNVVSIGSTDPEASLGLLERIIYVHEYTHALQDQHFDLDAYLELSQDANNNDMSLARTALVEGDATYVMNEYAIVEANKNPLGSLLELAVGGSQMGGLTLPAGTPAILGTELLFPYLEGEKFVRALREQGGQPVVDRAFYQPPSSTEQILHPELYISGEDPVVVMLPVTPPDDSWTPITNGVLGEFYLEQHLLTQLSPEDARNAAAGWGGDAFQIYQRGDGTLAYVLLLVWDSPEEKREFQTIYDTFANAQLGIAAQDGCYNGTEGFTGSQYDTCVEWRDHGSYIAYAPTEEIARQLIADAVATQEE